MELLEKFLAQMGQLGQVWVPVVIFIAIVALLIWRGLVWHYGERIEGFEQRLKLRDDKIDFLEKTQRPPEHAEAAPAEPALPRAEEPEPPKREGREYVPDEVTPQFLRDLYRNHTTIQADKLAKAYLGKWMRIEANVLNVIQMGDTVAIQTRRKEAPDHTREGMSITWLTLHSGFDRAEMLRAGDRVVGEGQISKIDTFAVDLDPAELI